MTKKIERRPCHQADAPSKHINSAIISPQSETTKQFQTIRANLALAGFECRECIEGGYFISRWNLTKFCRDLADLAKFASEVRK